MGLAPSCPLSTVLQADGCFSSCPNGTASSSVYTNLCVSTLACPIGTDLDSTGLACTKVSRDAGWVVKTGDVCDTGYTEWAANTCYKNCPSTFMENAFDCRKITSQRTRYDPQCEIGTRFANGKCELETVKLGVMAAVVYVAAKWYIEETVKSFV